MDDLSGVNIQETKISIDPTILFTRLIALAQSDENIHDPFANGVTYEPTPLFKEGLMKIPQKFKLRMNLMNKRYNIITNVIELCVVDSGALFHI